MADARSLYEEALKLQQQGRLAEAEPLYRDALAQAPDNYPTRYMFALLRFQQQRGPEALEAIGEALKRSPGAPDALFLQGTILKAAGRYVEALASFDGVLAQRPDDAGVWFTRGTVLQSLERMADALAAFDKAVALKPDHALAFYTRGLLLKSLNRLGEAVRSYDYALMAKPDYFEALFHRGIALNELGQREQAVASYDKALALQPDSVAAINNRSATLMAMRHFEEAARGYRRLEELTPGSSLALNGLANCATQACDWSLQAQIRERLRREVMAGNADIQPGTLIGYNDDPGLQLACARNIAKTFPAAPSPLWRGKPFSGAKIKLAYCSADFQSHPVPRLLAGVFEHHDRAKFEVVAISFSPDDKSEFRARLEKAFDQFHDVLTVSDAAIAGRMADLKVDIAIDLMGFTTRARSGIFARRPAPIIVNYMGYPGSLGTEFHDYVLADPIVLPMDQQAYYSEMIAQLPDSYFATDGTRPPPPPAPSRAEAGLPEQGFVFCCFNNNWKISKDQFDVWMRLLEAVPQSVLWLLKDNTEVADNLRRHAAARGVAPERLIFAPRVTQDAHLARHGLADLFLDTLPYNAHTTACDSLWVGVPLVTMMGRSLYARVAASVLAAMGLNELITDNIADYEKLALALARDPARLAAIRQKIETSRATAPLFDTARFTRNMEAAYLRMAEIWRGGQGPQSFSIRG